MLKKIVIILFLFLATYSPVSARDFYVSGTSGSDNNNGLTQDTAWKSIHFAANNATVQPGDTINVLPGTYTESVRVNGLTTGRCGSNGNYVTLKGYDTNNRPILTGATSDLRARVKIENCSYYKVENFNFNTFYNGGLHFYNSASSGMNISHLQARNNNFENQNATQVTGITDWTSTLLVMAGYENNKSMSQVVIENNTFKNVVSGNKELYNENLAVEGNASKVVIQNNYLENISYLGLALKGHEGAPCAECAYGLWQAKEIVVRKNTINRGIPSNYGLGGIYIEGAKGVLAEGNHVENIPVSLQISDEPWRQTVLSFDRYIFRDNTSKNNSIYGMKVGHGSCAPGYYPKGFTAHDTVYDAAVANNVFEGSKQGAGTVRFSKAKDIALKNNIYLSQQAGDIYSVEYAPYNDGWELNGNLMCTNNQKFTTLNTNPNVNGCGVVSYTSLSAFKTATGFEQSSILDCPTFKSGSYDLESGSPGKEQGISLTTTDASGNNTNAVKVKDAKYFYDGWGIEGEIGDKIKIDGKEAIITAVNYDTNVLTLDRNLSYANNAPVNYYYEGDKPSIGLLPNSFYDKDGTDPTPTPVQTPTPTATPTPTPKYDSKYDLNNDNKVTVMDIIELIKYVFQ